MDGLWAVSRSPDHDLILWDVHQRTPVYRWEWRDNQAEPVISPDSQSIAGLSEEKYLLLYNLQSPASPLTELVLPRSSEVEYYPSTNGTVLPHGAFVWSADGAQLVVYISTLSHDQVHVFSRLPTWTLCQCISFEKSEDKGEFREPKLSLNNQDQFLVVAWPYHKKDSYQFWNLTRGTVHYQPLPSHWNEESLGFIEFYKHYAIYSRRRSSDAATIEVFDMLAQCSLGTLSHNCRDVAPHTIWISQDQSYIAGLFNHSIVKTWNLATQTQIHTFQDSYAVVAALETYFGWFSPDGRHVLLLYWDRVLRLLRVDDGACLATFAPSGSPQHIQFSPDGMTICYTIRHDESGCVYFEPIGHLLS